MPSWIRKALIAAWSVIFVFLIVLLPPVYGVLMTVFSVLGVAVIGLMIYKHRRGVEFLVNTAK